MLNQAMIDEFLAEHRHEADAKLFVTDGLSGYMTLLGYYFWNGSLGHHERPRPSDFRAWGYDGVEMTRLLADLPRVFVRLDQQHGKLVPFTPRPI